MSIYISKSAEWHRRERIKKQLQRMSYALNQAIESHGEVYVHYGTPEVTQKLITASELKELLDELS